MAGEDLTCDSSSAQRTRAQYIWTFQKLSAREGEFMHVGQLTISSLAGFCLLAVGTTASAGHKFVEFDVPGAAGTFPISLNGNNDVVGYYEDTSGIDHAFIRTSDGKIKKFDVPKAASTIAGSINTEDEVAGTFFDSQS